MDKLKRLWSIMLSLLFPDTKDDRLLEALERGVLASHLRLRAYDPVESDSLWYLFSFREPLVRESIHALKYRGRRAIAKHYAHYLFDTLLECVDEWQTFENCDHFVVLPIPISKRRLKIRNYNQSELIVCGIEALDVDHTFSYSYSALRRVDKSESQVVQASRALREENIRGAFEVTRPNLVRDQNIILIDDVITTGSTMRAASKALYDAGAKRVICIAMAH